MSNYMKSGSFQVGCNYWASHAGMLMWRRWNAKVVEDDLKQLADEGLQTLRVFPLWPDFQPLSQIYSGLGTKRDLRIGEAVLSNDPAGQAGVSLEAMERFRFMADKAEENGLQLIVGLITGWMSGRLFVPPAFEGLNVITDPLVNKWQCRFVRYFVNEFKDHPAIAAWDLGNECNCMGKVTTSDESWAWTALISGTIRQVDPEKPVVSGMHGLSMDGDWTLQDQGELTDILTTHPYPIFTAYCKQDPVHYLRNSFHAPAQSRMYADLGKKPCFAEEMGTLGPMVSSEKIAADYVRSALFTLWSQDCRAMLWWCAYDQDHLDFAPYDTGSCERELGLIRNDRDVKPVLKEVGSFRRQIESLPIEKLPACKREAVCILTPGQDQWGAAYGSFILAKQAGFDIRFQYANEDLTDADLYLLPSLKSGGATLTRLRDDLYRRVEAGASLYVSFDGAFFQPFSKFFGLDVDYREEGSFSSDVTFDSIDSVLPTRTRISFHTHSVGAEVLATEDDGNVVFACNSIGKGQVYYLSFPLEQMLSETRGAFHGETAKPYYRIYGHVAKDLIAKRVLRVAHPEVTVTEHELDSGEIVAVVVHHAPGEVTADLDLSEGWEVKDAWIGEVNGSRLTLQSNNGAVLLIKR